MLQQHEEEEQHQHHHSNINIDICCFGHHPTTPASASTIAVVEHFN
jgi:hypothetical protein